MSRTRVLSGKVSAETEHAMTQAWHSLVDTLRHLQTVQGGDDRRAAQAEKQTLDAAIEQLGTLLELRKTAAAGGDTPRASPAPMDGIMTPPSSVKRKRRPSVSATASPAPMPAPHTGGSESALSSIPSPHHIRAGTPLGGRESKRARYDELPLRTGRRVAVKQKMFSARGKEDEDGGDWILASVRKMLSGDKTRYEVQDADDGTRWATTLKSIILLPDVEAPPTSAYHPSNLEDFPRGAQVLGLYPDTTSFYRATVVSAPIPGTGMGHGMRGGNGRADPGAKAGQYRLAFVDDGDNVHDVDKHMVVQYPGDK